MLANRTFHKISLIICVIVCVLIALPSIGICQQDDKPITRTHLVSSLKLGRRKRIPAENYIELIKHNGVDFSLKPTDNAEDIRRAGKYLGEEGLNNLITAVRNNYRPPTTGPSPINQTMTNSPGGIQAGGSVTVNQGTPPRRLTAEQEAQFVKILKDNPKGSVEVSCIESGGPEPCDFARQLVRLLEAKDAGWKVNFAPIMFGAGDPTKIIPEMYILVQSDKNPPPRAVVLQYALKSVGYDAIGIARSDVPADFVQLTIWFRNPTPPPSPISTQQPDFPVEKIITTSEAIPAEREDLPFGLRLTIQSNVTISPVHFLVECSGPIGEARDGPLGGGVLTMHSWNTQGNRHEFRYESPPLSPQKPAQV